MGDPDLLPEGWNGEGDDDPDPLPLFDRRSNSLNEEMDDINDPPISLAAGDRSLSLCDGVAAAELDPLADDDEAAAVSRLSKNPDPTRFGK